MPGWCRCSGWPSRPGCRKSSPGRVDHDVADQVGLGQPGTKAAHGDRRDVRRRGTASSHRLLTELATRGLLESGAVRRQVAVADAAFAVPIPDGVALTVALAAAPSRPERSPDRAHEGQILKSPSTTVTTAPTASTPGRAWSGGDRSRHAGHLRRTAPLKAA